MNVLRSCLLLFASAFMADTLLCLALSNCTDGSGGGGDLHIHIGTFSEPSVSPLGWGGVWIQAAPSRRVAVWALIIWKGARQEKDKEGAGKDMRDSPEIALTCVVDAILFFFFFQGSPGFIREWRGRARVLRPPTLLPESVPVKSLPGCYSLRSYGSGWSICQSLGVE